MKTQTKLKDRIKTFKQTVTQNPTYQRAGALLGASMLLVTTLTGCKTNQGIIQPESLATSYATQLSDPDFVSQREEDIKTQDTQLGIQSDPQILDAEIKALQERIAELEGLIEESKYSKLSQISTTISDANQNNSISQEDLIEAINRLTEEVAKQSNTIIIENNPTFNNNNNTSGNFGQSGDIAQLQATVNTLAQEVAEIKGLIENSQIEKQMAELLTLVQELQDGKATKEDVNNAVVTIQQSIANANQESLSSINEKLDVILSQLENNTSTPEQGGNNELPSTALHPLDGVQELYGKEDEMVGKILLNLSIIKMDLDAGIRNDHDSLFDQLVEVETLVERLNFSPENAEIVNKELDFILLSIIEHEIAESYTEIASKTGYIQLNSHSDVPGSESYSYREQTLFSEDGRSINASSTQENDYQRQSHYFDDGATRYAVYTTHKNGQNLEPYKRVQGSNPLTSTPLEVVDELLEGTIIAIKEMRMSGSCSDIDFSKTANEYNVQFECEDIQYDMSLNKNGVIGLKGRWEEACDNGSLIINANAGMSINSITKEYFEEGYKNTKQYVEGMIAYIDSMNNDNQPQ